MASTTTTTTSWTRGSRQGTGSRGICGSSDVRHQPRHLREILRARVADASCKCAPSSYTPDSAPLARKHRNGGRGQEHREAPNATAERLRADSCRGQAARADGVGEKARDVRGGNRAVGEAL